MRNFFVRNYISYACLILVSFTMAGAIFSFQVNKYSLNEKQDQLNQTAASAANMTGIFVSSYSVLGDLGYQVFMRQMARDSNASIVVTDTDGRIVLYADAQGESVEHAGQVSSHIIKQVMKNNYYKEMGTLGSIMTVPSYVVGTQCMDMQGNTIGIVFVGMAATAVSGLLQDVMKAFFVILSAALASSLVISYFIAGMLTRPMRSMVIAAKQFARGNFSVRVTEDNHCDEIDELAVAFNNMAGALEQSEELSRGFIANVSHELKTPMTSIAGFVDGMLDGTIPPEKHDQYLAIIADEVKRLSRLILRMLDAAKIEAGELVLNPAPFDLSEMSSRIILSFEKPINDKHLEMDIAFEDRLIVNGDRDHVFQVVYNLVDNAVKFIDEGGKLSMSAVKEGNNSRFSIRNTGIGIPEEDLPHVFDRFYKVDRSRSRDKTGAGLGLYIVKTIINLHGGDISVRSGGGETEFSFTLPLAANKAAKQLEAQANAGEEKRP